MEIENVTPNNTHSFFCNICQFKTSNKKDYKRHIDTQKHKFNQKSQVENNCQYLGEKKPLESSVTNTITFENNTPNKNSCQCGKIYKDKSGLWRHKKICKIINENEQGKTCKDHMTEPADISDKQIIAMLIKENAELKNFIMDVLKKII
jgi:hypothetical protein